MKTKSLSLLLVSAFLILGACQKPDEKNADKKTAKKEVIEETAKDKVYPVVTTSIKETIIDKELEYTANLVASEEYYLGSSTPGQIQKMYAEVGDRVQKGSQLVKLDETQLNQALIQLNSLEVDYKRMQTLFNSGSISKQQYDQIKTQYDVLTSNVEFLKKNIYLKAPFNAIVIAKYFEDGEMYSGAPNTQAGKSALYVLNQIEELKAMINVSEQYYPMIKKGMSANISSDIYPNKKFDSKVKLVHPTIDPLTRSFNVELGINNQNEVLRPGMFVRVNLNVGQTKAILAPSIAVLKQEGTNNRFVFINENDVAKRIEVEIGKRFDDKIEIISEQLKEGDRLIVVGQASLLNGYKVVEK